MIAAISRVQGHRAAMNKRCVKKATKKMLARQARVAYRGLR